MTAYAISRFAFHKNLEQPFRAAVDTLRLCHSQGIKTALVTSKSDVELSELMSRFEGASYVDVTVCASDVVHPKPAPESALRACQMLGVEPSRSVMIGDSVYDMRCAKAARIRTVAVTYGAGLPENLRAESPDLVFGTPEELLSWAESAFLEPTCRGRS
jgi:pyrophosphatase PpaX